MILKEALSEGQIKLTTLSIFTNNLKVALFIYMGGLLFGSVYGYLSHF